MANYSKLKVIWRNNLNDIYKENTIIGVGQEAVINISENGISNIYVNFKVNNEFFTDLVEINGNVIQVPFRTDVLKAGTHQLEIVAHLKNGDVVPSSTFSYYVGESLENAEAVKSDTHYPILIELLEQVEEWNEGATYQEEQRIANENERKSNEINRQSNENTRKSNETNRQQYETQRRAEEDERLTDEQVRVKAENIRIANENERLRKEIERQNAEELRQISYNSSLYGRMDGVEEQLVHIEKIVLSPDMYGCIGDGLTDDTLNFQKCINDAIKQGGMINGLGKTYMISDAQQLPSHIESRDYGLYIEGSLHLYNCKFILKDGCLGRTTILNIANPVDTRVVIESVTIDGNGSNQSTDISSQDGGLHGLRVGYNKLGLNAGGFELLNSTIKNCYSDCITVRDIKFDFMRIANCKIISSGRNGITDNSYNSIIENCTFADNGWRTAPKSAYHIEGDGSCDYGVKVMRDCRFEGTKGDDYMVHVNHNTFNIDSLLIDNCIMNAFGFAHYCENECYTNNIIISNSKISSFIIGNGTDTISKHIVKNINIDNSSMSYIRIKATDLDTKTNFIANNTSFGGVLYISKSYNKIIFNNCTFYRKTFEDKDAVANNVFYFDYDVSGENSTTDELSFINCTFQNVNRVIALGSSRKIYNIVLRNNIINCGHVILNGDSSVSNAILDGNIIRPLGAPGTSGKIRLGENTNYMLAVNNMFYGSELMAFGNYKPVNSIKANNIFNMTE